MGAGCDHVADVDTEAKFHTLAGTFRPGVTRLENRRGVSWRLWAGNMADVLESGLRSDFFRQLR